MTTIVTNVSEAIKNLKRLTDDVVDSGNHVLITKPKNRNAIIISEREYESWKETMYLFSSETNHKNLDESLKQLKKNNIKTLSKEEWYKYSHEN